MFSKASRFDKTRSQTMKCVGPTTYIICDRQRIENVCYKAPFLSSEEKTTCLFNKYYNENYYSIPDLDPITGGSSPRYTAERFQYSTCGTPGPGDYFLSDDELKEKKEIPKGRLYVCKVPIGRPGRGPSIPTKLNENGYDLDNDGNPVSNPPDDHDTTLGPAFYKIKDKTFCEYYKGCKWSKRTSKRPLLTSNIDYPGPADYCPQEAKCISDWDDECVREMARKCAKSLRYLDAEEIRCKRENIPGPAHYNIKSDRTFERCEGIYPTPFICGQKRFKINKNLTPSPVDYTIEKTSKIYRQTAIISSRFKNKHDLAPGPADYCIPSPISEKIYKKSNPFSLVRVPFNTASVRNTIDIPKDSSCTPSPAEYSLPKSDYCKIKTNSVFKSAVPRFANGKGDRSRGCDLRKCYRTTRSFNARRNIGFGGFSKRKSLFDEVKDYPGPGDYDLTLTEGGPHHIIPFSDRFPCEKEQLPGPGWYKENPNQSAINGAFKSHNLIIKENVLKTKLRTTPAETFQKWCKTLTKSKQLRCYHGVFGSRHC